jgi:ketosteroid isomerase-like protein
MSDRQQRIRDAFVAYDRGDLDDIRALFAPDAQWVAIPSGDEIAACHGSREIVGRLEQVRERGRRFTLGRMIEDRDRVAVEWTIADPSWSDPVQVFKVFAFAPGGDVVVRLNDCVDESYALQVLAA